MREVAREGFFKLARHIGHIGLLTLSLLAVETAFGGPAALAQINPACTPLPYSGNNPDVTPNTLLDSDELPNSGSATELACERSQRRQ